MNDNDGDSDATTTTTKAKKSSSYHSKYYKKRQKYNSDNKFVAKVAHENNSVITQYIRKI